MWGTFLSEPLPIDALVGRYPANELMVREPLLEREPCGPLWRADDAVGRRIRY